MFGVGDFVEAFIIWGGLSRNGAVRRWKRFVIAVSRVWAALWGCHAWFIAVKFSVGQVMNFNYHSRAFYFKEEIDDYLAHSQMV